MQLNTLLRRTAIVFVLFAASLPPVTRALVGPLGATVHVRWQESITESERKDIAARLHLADGERIEQDTWRYDLLDPSRRNIRALLAERAVADTQNIDRSNNALEPSADRTARRQRFPVYGDRAVELADLIAISLAGSSALLMVVGVALRMPATRNLYRRTRRLLLFQPSAATVPLGVEGRGGGRPGLWTALVLAAAAPAILTLCATLWNTPFPITEAVATFEDVEIQPLARYLSPDRTYFRPAYFVTISAIWHSAASLDTRLAWIRLLTIVPLVLLVALFVWHLRPRTAPEAAAAGMAVAVLIGSPGLRDNLEIVLPYSIIGMLLAMVVWMVVNRERRIWHTPFVIACTLVAIGFKEQGLLLVPLVIAAWWTRAPGASRRLAVTVAVVGIAYVAFRLTGQGLWQPFEQRLGFGFAEFDEVDASARFGAFPYWMYAYSAVSTMANVLFAEPTAGVFRVVHAVVENRTELWHLIYTGSSVALTAAIAWWGIHCSRDARRAGWSPESRLFVALVVVLLASGALSFNYSRDRLGGVAAVFYAIAAFSALRAAASRMMGAPRVTFVMASLGLALLVAGWQTRAVATVEHVRLHSWRNQREWFDELSTRRIAFAHRAAYLRIMESMVEQGTNPAAPRPTRFPDWTSNILVSHDIE